MYCIIFFCLVCSSIQSDPSISVSQPVEDYIDRIVDERCNWYIDGSDLMLFVLSEPILQH